MKLFMNRFLDGLAANISQKFPQPERNVANPTLGTLVPIPLHCGHISTL